jgi:hypothetical protein
LGINENANEDNDDLEAEEALLLDEYAISFAAFEMSADREMYEAKEALLNEYGTYCLIELARILKEYQEDWETLRHTAKELEKAFKKIDEKREKAKQARLEGKDKKKKEKAPKSKESIAFGVPDFYALVRDSLIRFDDLNLHEGVVRKDNVKKIRKIMIYLIITEQRSTTNLSREVLERLAKAFLTSGIVRTARNQLKRYQNTKK